jgi:hypothetical protein
MRGAVLGLHPSEIAARTRLQEKMAEARGIFIHPDAGQILIEPGADVPEHHMILRAAGEPVFRERGAALREDVAVARRGALGDDAKGLLVVAEIREHTEQGLRAEQTDVDMVVGAGDGFG